MMIVLSILVLFYFSHAIELPTDIFIEDKVRLDLFVMSRCPDAVFCEGFYDHVLNEIGSIVDLNVNYIARTEGETLVCKAGEVECAGNIQQLCARRESGDINSNWWKFIICQDETFREIPLNGEACAQRVGLNWASMSTCIDGPIGRQLFQESVKFTDSYGITTSCTMHINDEYYCVRDGAQWKNCAGESHGEVIAHICSLYKGTQKPPACAGK